MNQTINHFKNTEQSQIKEELERLWAEYITYVEGQK